MQALRLVNTSNLSHEEWLDWRRKGITGSDIGAICGVNPWSSPMTVYLDKIGELPAKNDNDKMLFGRLYEPVIAKEFSKRTGLKVEQRNAILQHPEIPWALASIDRLIIDKQKGNGVLEVKTASAYAKKDWESAKVPEQYMLQLQWYMFVTGLKYGYFAVECGHEYFQHYIERDDELINLVLEKFIKPFWLLVENRTPPVIDGSTASSELLSKMYPDSVSGSQLVLPDEAKDLLTKYEEAKADEDAAKARKDEAANKLKDILGSNERGLIGERKVIWSTVITNRVDTKTLKAEQPDIYKKYVKETKSRRFTVI